MNKLEICATSLGKTAAVKARNIHGSVNEAVWLVDTEEWYDPEHNDAQAMELLKWYIEKKIGKIQGGHDCYNPYPSSLSEILLSVLNKNYRLDNQAIINAVCAMEDTP